MPILRYVSHAEVNIDPDVLVPDWNLSSVGRARTEALAALPWVADLSRIVSSSETKAAETATILAAAAGLAVEIRAETAEVDRSSTGYLSHGEHEAQANRLFAAPLESTQGWERAIDAQQRMIDNLVDLLDSETDVAVVGHGGVGTLWWCHLAGIEISRKHDQSSGGQMWEYDLATRTMCGRWRRFEDC